MQKEKEQFMEAEFNNFKGYYIQPELKQTIKHLEDIIIDDDNFPKMITLLGPLGSGKRTLAMALSEEYLQRNEKAQLMKLTADEVVEQVIDGIRGDKNTYDVKESFVTPDFLIVTGLEDMFAKIQSNQVLKIALTKRIENKKPSILTINQDESTLSPRAGSYFTLGTLVSIPLPGFKLRKKLVAESIKKFDYEVSEEIIEYIADYVVSDMNLINTIVRNIVIRELKEEKEIDLTHVKNVMKDFVSIKGQWV